MTKREGYEALMKGIDEICREWGGSAPDRYCDLCQLYNMLAKLRNDIFRKVEGSESEKEKRG